MGYVKLFADILASTIWDLPPPTKVVWITLLAMADRHGDVMASLPGIAHLSRVSVDEARLALEQLSAPDPDSRTQDHDGRRLMRIDGGWKIVNYEKHRRRMSADDQREKAAARQARRRLGRGRRDKA